MLKELQQGWNSIKLILAVLVLLYLVYTCTLVWFSHKGFPQNMSEGFRYPYLADKPLGEDGYYMLTVAWNIASGKGIVYNYDIPTSGVQPLSTGIYAIIALIVQQVGGDKWTFAQAILGFGSFLLLLLAHIVGIVTRDLFEENNVGLAYFTGFVGILFNYSLYRLFTYGLETGIYLICLALVLYYTLKLFGKKSLNFNLRSSIVLGVLSGLTAWARIDFIVVFSILMLLLLVRYKIRVIWPFISGIVVAVIISPWFLYSYIATGDVIPSSGSSQAALINSQSIPIRIQIMSQSLIDHISPWMYTNLGSRFVRSNFGIMISVVSFISTAVLFTFLVNGSLIKFLRSKADILIIWISAILMLALIYVVFFGSDHFYQRYSSPIIIPAIIVMSLAFAKRMKNFPRTTQILPLFVMPICFFGWSYLSLHTGRIGSDLIVAAGFVQQHYQSAKVGAFQSGIIGYFNSNVINLDGKVNKAALDYLRMRQLESYIDGQEINVLVDWPSYFSMLDSDWLNNNWQPCNKQPDADTLICLQRRVLRTSTNSFLYAERI